MDYECVIDQEKNSEKRRMKENERKREKERENRMRWCRGTREADG